MRPRDRKGTPLAPSKQRAHAYTIKVHASNLLFSAICYFAAYGVTHGSDPVAANSVKLFLWYFPLLVEIFVHFYLIMHLRKSSSESVVIRYPPSAVFLRSVTLFTVVLGGGKIFVFLSACNK